MRCTKCDKHISQCECPDLETRLKQLSSGESSALVYKKCQQCGNHYARCRCENPVWVSTDPGVPLPKH